MTEVIYQVGMLALAVICIIGGAWWAALVILAVAGFVWWTGR